MNPETLSTIETFLSASLRMATPLALAGLGNAYSEKSGILNIGLEGIMLSGAFFSFIVAFLTQNIFLGLLAGITGGILLSLIHAFMSIRLKADQTIIGLALNFFSMGLTSYLFLIIFGKSTTLPECPVVGPLALPLLSRIPILGKVLFSQDIFVYFLFIAIFLSWIIFYRTEWGTILHAVGEHPKAADSAGINVSKTRYITALINGFFGGIAGSYMTLAMLGFFMENITSGKGYIALVVVILGRRNPLGILAASLLIGSADALQFRIQTMGSSIPSQVFIMFPYVMTVLVLLFSVKKSNTPTALGIPFVRTQR
jgi:simple sugar transport system permease protein